jgi:hypothetical protein
MKRGAQPISNAQNDRRFHRLLQEGVSVFRHRRCGHRPSAQQASVLTAELRARIVSAMHRKPKDGSTHSSCRKAPAQLFQQRRTRDEKGAVRPEHYGLFSPTKRVNAR